MKKAKVGVVAVLLVAMVACSTTWVSQAMAILNVALPAVTNVLTLIAAFSGKGVDPTELTQVQQIGTEINADLTGVKSLIDQFNSASAADQPALLTKIQDALKVAQANITQILTALHIKDQTLAAKINAVVGAVISEVTSIQALIPIAQGGATASTMRRAAARVPNAKAFKLQFNAVMTAKTGNSELDAKTQNLAVK